MKLGDRVLYKNNQFIAVNKWAGVPVQADKTGDPDLHTFAMAYAKRPLYLIHRIDRPVSGVVLFGRNPKAAASLAIQQQEGQVLREYLAVVSKGEGPINGELSGFLEKSHKHKKALFHEEASSGAKEASIKYEQIGEIDRYALLRIITYSGRYHQIRAMLGHLNLPVKGDVKYGFKRGNTDRSIHLHSHKMTFIHPISKEEQVIIAPLPDEVTWTAFQF